MSEAAAPPINATRSDAFARLLKKRYAAERRFKAFGLAAVLFSVAVLVFLLGTMLWNGIGGFQRTELAVPIDLASSGLTADPVVLAQGNAVQTLEAQGLPQIVAAAAEQSLGPAAVVAVDANAWRVVAARIAAEPALAQTTATFQLPASPRLAAGFEGEGSPEMQALAQRLGAEGKLAKNFDVGFLTRSDATSSQYAGVWGALKGSMLTMLVTDRKSVV